MVFLLTQIPGAFGYAPRMREISIDQVVEQLHALGVDPGGVLLVHTSFKAIGPIEGGPPGLIQALRRAIGADGTPVMPTMTDGESVFDPASTPTSAMGITDLEHALGGQVLLLGVGHGENTTLHVAEAIAEVPCSISHPCVVEIESDGVVRTVMIAETDHCCRGFGQMDDWLRERGLQREGPVGNGDARLCASRDVIAIAVAHLGADPLVFLCAASEGCEECDAARGSLLPA